MDDAAGVLVADLNWVLERVLREVAALDRDELAAVLGALIRIVVRDLELDLVAFGSAEGALARGLDDELVLAAVSAAVLDSDCPCRLVEVDDVEPSDQVTTRAGQVEVFRCQAHGERVQLHVSGVVCVVKLDDDRLGNDW